MADEDKPQAGSETPAEQPKTTPTNRSDDSKASRPAKTWEDEFDPDRAKNTIDALRGDKRELKEENKTLKGQLDEFTRKLAGLEPLLDKVTKLETALTEAETARKQSELNAARDHAAAIYGLPPELAKRLTGDTPEAIEKDAEELAKALPRPPGSRFSPGNTGENVSGPKVVDQVLERMRGRKSGPSEASQPSVHRMKGGGVVGVDTDEA